ncbi:hypothetical protein [Kocuria palustris]
MTASLRELVRVLLDTGTLGRAGASMPEQPPVGGFRTVPVTLD